MAELLNEMETLSEEEIETSRRREQEATLESLGMSVMSKFSDRARRRGVKENQWLRASNLYYGNLALPNYYKGETPFEVGIYAKAPDVNIVRSKCAIAIANSVSMQFGASNKNWDLLPAKTSVDPGNTIACEGMSAEIETQLEETKYPLHARKAMWDRVVLGTGILKGPISVGTLERSYTQIPGTGTWEPKLAVNHSPTSVRVNPWFFYPDEGTDDPTKLEDCIEAHPMSALMLKKYREHPGFKQDAIDRVLERAPEEFNTTNYAKFAELSEANPHLFKDKYLVLEYHGPITRTQLDKLEICPTYDSVNEEYYGEVWVCQGEVIRIELESIEASFKIPYYICVWEKDPGSVFGFGVPLMMEDAQRVVNESWHMILDNSALSSAPQIGMHKHMVEPANGKWEFAPKALWYLTDTQVDIQKAIQFFNIPNVTENIIPIMQMAQGFGEEESGIPLIAAGLNSPQTQDTATGDLVMRHASTTLLDFMSEDWDDNITSPLIQAYYGWNMQYSNKPDIKGNFTVDVRTSTEYKNKQLHIRDLEKLSVECAQNPEMAKWIDQPALQRARLTLMTLPTRDIIKSKDVVEQEEAERQANAQPDPKILELELKSREVAIKEAELELEANQLQRREEMEHNERMSANLARLVESEARVAVSQNEKDTEILKLAARSEETAMKLVSGERIARENNLTKTFHKSLEETRKQQENQIWNEELQFKKSTGKQGV